ncbi:MAG: Transcriptional regulator, AraC family, partial [uncultured Blastococcus sp.]
APPRRRRACPGRDAAVRHRGRRRGLRDAAPGPAVPAVRRPGLWRRRGARAPAGCAAGPHRPRRPRRAARCGHRRRPGSGVLRRRGAGRARRRPAGRVPAGRPDRQRLHRRLRPGRGRAARRAAGDHALDACIGLGRAVPCRPGRPARALRGGRPGRDVGGHRGGDRPVPRTPAPRPRDGDRGRGGAAARGAPAPAGRPGPVRLDALADHPRLGAGAPAGLGAVPPGPAAHPGTARSPGPHHHPHAHAPVHRRAGAPAAAVAHRRAGPPGPPTAGGHRPVDRAGRPAERPGNGGQPATALHPPDRDDAHRLPDGLHPADGDEL